MKHLADLNVLIDKASAIAGSDYKLAKMLKSTPQKISDWRHGRSSCPVAFHVLMADIAGLDPVATLARAVVQQNETSKQADMLVRVLGKASRATGAVIGFAGACAIAIFSMTPTPSQAAPAHPEQHNVHYVK